MKINNKYANNSGENPKPAVFVGQNFLRFTMFCPCLLCSSINGRKSYTKSESLVLECLSIQRSQTHLQTVICISEVADQYFLLLIKSKRWSVDSKYMRRQRWVHLKLQFSSQLNVPYFFVPCLYYFICNLHWKKKLAVFNDSC